MLKLLREFLQSRRRTKKHTRRFTRVQKLDLSSDGPTVHYVGAPGKGKSIMGEYLKKQMFFPISERGPQVYFMNDEFVHYKSTHVKVQRIPSAPAPCEKIP